MNTPHSTERDADLDPAPVWPTHDPDVSTQGHGEQHLLSQWKITGALGDMGVHDMIQVADIVPELSDAERAQNERERKIADYMDIAGVVSNSWIESGGRKDEARMYGSRNNSGAYGFYGDQKMSLVGNAAEALRSASASEVRSQFQKHGINELCTVQPITAGFVDEQTGKSYDIFAGIAGSDVQKQEYAREPLRAIVYEASGPGYNDGFGRPGNTLLTKFIFPQSVAERLEVDAHSDPLILRGMAEWHMRESVLTDKGKGAWERYGRPPYETWDARPEGNVMAFRSDFAQGYKAVDPEDLVAIPS